MAAESSAIRTDRLDLVLFSAEKIADLLAGRSAAIGEVSLPADLVRRTERTFRRRLDQLRSDPACADWLLRAMILRETDEFVGRIGFHGPPGTNALGDPGALEFGYTVEPDFRRRGLAEEAIRGMMSWAGARSITRFLLSISPTNVPSLRLAAKLGFAEIARVEDEDGDGPEIVFALSRSGDATASAPPSAQLTADTPQREGTA